jgi:thioesterase domain-containing protein
VAPPRSPLEESLADIWQDVLKVKPIGVTDSFFDLGGHSLLAAVLVARVRERLGRGLPLGVLFTAPTVERMAAVIEQNADPGSASPLVALRSGGSRPPLFLFPGVGGHVFTYQSLTELLGPDQPVYGLKAIGIDGTEKPLTRVEDMARRYRAEVLRVWPRGPFLLGGYSFGGLVAFELACRLRAEGHPVQMLALFDTFAPGYPVPLPAYQRLAVHARNLWRGGPRKFLPYLGDRLRNLRRRLMSRISPSSVIGGKVEGADESTNRVLRQVKVALLAAGRSYRPGGRYPDRVLLLAAEEGVDWVATSCDDPLLGWGKWLGGNFEVRKVPGSHLGLFAGAGVSFVSRALRKEMGIQ